MAQALGFVDAQHLDYVYRLHKSLYSLKQAPRTWNERFTRFLSLFGYISNYSC